MNFGRVINNAQQKERWLLISAGLFLVVISLTYGIVTRTFWEPALLLAIWIAGAAIGHNALNRVLPQRDPLLFAITMLLSGWGLFMILRLAANFAMRQALWMIIGIAAMTLVTQLPANLRWLRRYRYTWLLGGLVLLLLTIFLGVNPSGAGPRLWLPVGPIYFQPSELLKVLLVVFLASYLADYHTEINRAFQSHRWLPSLRAIGPLVLMWSICMVMTILQQDLGAAALLFLVFLTMLYIASGHMRYMIIGILLLVAAAMMAYVLFDVVALRIDIWLNPWPEADNRGFQIAQSLIAFASGGVMGTGIGLGSSVYIPVVHSDFMIAAIGEEFGLIGASTVMLCIAFLVIRGIQLAALWSQSIFRMLLAAGVSVLIGVQSFLIMGGVLKIIPLTGLTLPFMSYGGSSLLISFVLIGLLLMLSSPSSTLEDNPA